MQLSWDVDKVIKLNSNINSWIELALTKIWLIIQNRAKGNAPFLTWTLRKSITTDFNKIRSWMVIVGSPISYATKREYENRTHPDTKFYLKRWYTENADRIMDIVKRYLSEKLN